MNILLNDKKSTGLTDYKFYCFNGEPKFLYVSTGLENHKTARISFLTLDWEFAPYSRSDYAPLDKLPARPKHFQEMTKLCEQLAKGHAFLRVDLYEISNKILFSELTFSPCAGYMPFKEDQHDKEIGDMIHLPNVTVTACEK